MPPPTHNRIRCPASAAVAEELTWRTSYPGLAAKLTPSAAQLRFRVAGPSAAVDPGTQSPVAASNGQTRPRWHDAGRACPGPRAPIAHPPTREGTAMLHHAITASAIAALGGFYPAPHVLRGRLAPWAVSLRHAG